MINKPNYRTLLEASSLVNFTTAAVSSVTSKLNWITAKTCLYLYESIKQFARSKTMKGVLPNHSKTERQDFLKLIPLT